MSEKSKSIQIFHDPQTYLSNEGKKLEDRLKEISIDPDDKELIVRHQTGKTIRDSILGSFPAGQVFSTLLSWNETIDSEIDDAKKEKLLEIYFDKSDANEDSLQRLKYLMTNPQGNTIFNKIIRILIDSPPDVELIGHLAAALKHISETDFVRLFEEHKYALSQIEKLTPQGLTILSDYRSWPRFSLASYHSNGGKIVSDWLSDFVGVYAPRKGIEEPALADRLAHALNDLQSFRLVEAWLAQEQEKVACVVPTSIGKTIIRYVDA